MYRYICRREGESVASKYNYETTFCREFNFGFHKLAKDLPRQAGEDSSRGGAARRPRDRCKDVRELKNNCKAAAQVGRRGYAAASLDLQQVRANFVIARVGSFLSKMLTEQTILALICMTRKIGFRSDILHEYCRFTVNGIFTPTVN